MPRWTHSARARRARIGALLRRASLLPLLSLLLAVPACEDEEPDLAGMMCEVEGEERACLVDGRQRCRPSAEGELEWGLCVEDDGELIAGGELE